ncbi:hypothetical protein J6590_087463 [Homalodisca vitripennis]|nr:hypothetical protein J6590_087463 [Homalodisca vitripennis]
MDLLNPKAWLETQKDLQEHFEAAIRKPTPFVVNSIDPIDDQNPATKCIFMSWTKHLESFYAKREFKIRPIREIMFDDKSFENMFYRHTYHGAWESTGIIKRNQSKNLAAEFTLPEASYNGPLPISAAKYADLQHLSKFCGPEAQDIFRKLKYK